MSSKFSIKQIAAQAGLSTATVDRVLNNRDGVRYQTRLRVHQAIDDLEDQAGLLGQSGRTLYVDLIMQAPTRFSGAVRQALLQVLPTLQPLRIRPRFHLYEQISVEQLARQVTRAARNGSQGVILKAPDHPAINQAVAELQPQRVPVVTLVTDLPASPRCGYIGMDNRAAGRTAAFLMGRWLGTEAARIALVLSSDQFRGEEEREIGFRQLLRQRFPQLSLVDLSGGLGVYENTLQRVSQLLAADPAVSAVYSIGGGNRAIVDAFRDSGRELKALIGHDLDDENRELLRQEQIDAVIDHDLEQDARSALLMLLAENGLVDTLEQRPSAINVVTPYSL